MARVTRMSKANVVNKIRELGRKIMKPIITEDQSKYEMDEMSALVERKMGFRNR